MLIYTARYVCLLVMIIFKGRKLLKGRKTDFCAAQCFSVRLLVVATACLVLATKGDREGGGLCVLVLAGDRAQLLCH